MVGNSVKSHFIGDHLEPNIGLEIGDEAMLRRVDFF